MDLSKYLDAGKALLSDAAQPLEAISSLYVLDKTFEKNEETESGDFKFSFEAGGGLKVAVYNDVNDDDEDQLVSGLNLDRYISDGQKAFLKYELTARLKGRTDLGIRAVQLGFALEKNVAFSSYLIHDRTEQLGPAVAADLTSLAMIFDREQLASMPVGSVVTASVASMAEFSGEIAWSDAVSTGLSRVTDLIGASSGLELSFSAGAKLGFSCSVAGEFQVIVQRREADAFFVDIRKKKSLSAAASGSLGVTAEIASNEEELTELVDALFNTLEKGVAARLKPLLEKAKAALSEQEKASIREAAEVLGLNAEDLDALKEAYTRRRDEVKEKLVEVLQTKISAGVSLEYSKVKRRETLFSAFFSKNEMLQYHGDIFTLKIARLVALKKGSAATKYQQITTLSIKKSFGISLGMGHWKAENSKESTLDLTREETLDGDDTSFKISNLSIGRSHTVSVGKENSKNSEINSILLSAKMPEPVSKKADATISTFDFECKLASETRYRELGIIDLHQLIDLGVVLELIAPDDYDEAYDRWKERIVHEKVSYDLLLNVPFGSFDAMMDEVAGATNREMALSMAAALPYLKLHGRENIHDRKMVYQQFFKTYLDTHDSSMTTENWGATLGEYLLKNGYKKLSDFEGSQTSAPWSNKNQYSFVGCFRHEGVKNNLVAFREAVDFLLSSPGKPYGAIREKVKGRLNSLQIGNDYTFRLLCRLLIDMAHKAGVEKELEKSLRITYKQADGEEVTAVLV